MKNYLITAIALFMIITTYAQPPQGFKYQAVVRDDMGNIIPDQNVGVRISIRMDMPTGPTIYQETHNGTTNSYGILNLEIGRGSPVGYYDFETIDWGQYTKFLKVEIDPDGNTNYVDMGTSELLSVPYALYAGESPGSDWEKSGNDIYYYNGNVGVGTSNPLSNFHVYGGALFRGPDAGISFGTGSDYGTIGYSHSNGYVNKFTLYSGKTIINGNVGMGAWDPTNAKLHLSGAGEFSNIIRMENMGTNGADCFIGSTSSPWGTAENSFVIGHGTPGSSNIDFVLNNFGWVGIGEKDPAYPLHVKKNAFGSWVAGLHNTDFDPGSNGLVVRADGGDPLWVQSNASTILSVKQNGRVGIGTTNPAFKLQVSTSGSEPAFQGYAVNNVAIYGASSSGFGVHGQSTTSYAGYFSGHVYITGSLSKGGGSFVIDHPLDPENKLLRHNFVESPENLLIYRGKIQLDKSGEAVVEMPDYFNALTMENEATIQITPIGKPLHEKRFEFSYEWLTSYDAFMIYGEPGRQISWMVMAERDDPVIHELARPVEEDKDDNNILCKKGKLLYPKAYGFPENKGMNYEYEQLYTK